LPRRSWSDWGGRPKSAPLIVLAAMLRFDLRALEQRPADVAGALQPGDQALEGVEVELLEPVRATGRLSSAGRGHYYWRGEIQTSLRTECRRCLASLTTPIRAEVDALFTDDPDADDPAVYIIPERVQVLDLGEVIREELVLAAPEFVVCREDCRGLCPRCGTDLNTDTCQCVPEPDSRWAVLEALKSTRSGTEE
jgi:DUF177 domain-containing protein